MLDIYSKFKQKDISQVPYYQPTSSRNLITKPFIITKNYTRPHLHTVAIRERATTSRIIIRGILESREERLIYTAQLILRIGSTQFFDRYPPAIYPPSPDERDSKTNTNKPRIQYLFVRTQPLFHTTGIRRTMLFYLVTI